MSALDGWTPIRVHERAETTVEWCWMHGISFTEPFFVQTVERAFRRPFSLLFRRETPIGALDEIEPGLTPNGFVFHVSRCGSTLVSQMLAAVPEHLVLSEPPPVDQLLRSRLPEDEKTREVRALVLALGRRRRGDESAYVIKLDAWNVRAIGTVRRAFPDVPWVFLYRDPVEVLASHMRHRGGHMVPGAIDPAVFALTEAEVVGLRPEEYCARVLASFFSAALEHRDGLALFLDYARLPGAADEIVRHFGIELDDERRAMMAAAAAFDAKSPTVFFTAEEAPVSQELRAAADRIVRPLYEETLAC